MELPNDLTYEKAAEMVEERKPDPKLLIEVQNTFGSFGAAAGKKKVASLFVKVRQLISGKSGKINKEARDAVAEYLTTIEAFEQGTLEQHAAGKSIADLL